MAKYTDAIRDAIIAAFNAGDQPTEAQFTNWITRVQEGIEEHQHNSAGDGDGTGALEGPVTINNGAISTTALYAALGLSNTKSAGVTDETDYLYSINSYTNFNQVGGVIGHIYGFNAKVEVTNGDVGSIGLPRTLAGISTEAELEAGAHIFLDVIGFSSRLDLNGGTVEGDVYGLRIFADIEGAMDAINGDIYGIYCHIDADEDPAGSAYLLYLSEASNIDYAIYQTGGTAPSYLTGNLGVKMAPSADGILCLGTPTETVEIIDAGSAGATQQDWIEVEVNGVQGYIHVYAAV